MKKDFKEPCGVVKCGEEANKDRLEEESYKVLILHHINAELSAALDWIEKTFSYFFIRLFF